MSTILKALMINGHAVGDEVLQVLARRLNEMAVGHCVGRLGGEKLGLIIDAQDPEKARLLAEKCWKRYALAERRRLRLRSVQA